MKITKMQHLLKPHTIEEFLTAEKQMRELDMLDHFVSALQTTVYLAIKNAVKEAQKARYMELCAVQMQAKKANSAQIQAQREERRERIARNEEARAAEKVARAFAKRKKEWLAGFAEMDYPPTVESGNTLAELMRWRETGLWAHGVMDPVQWEILNPGVDPSLCPVGKVAPSLYPSDQPGYVQREYTTEELQAAYRQRDVDAATWRKICEQDRQNANKALTTN